MEKMEGIIMKTIEERANEAYPAHEYSVLERVMKRGAYIRGAKEQKAIDEEVRLKKCDDMTQAEYDREVAFADWYYKNGKGTPTANLHLVSLINLHRKKKSGQ